MWLLFLLYNKTKKLPGYEQLLHYLSQNFSKS